MMIYRMKKASAPAMILAFALALALAALAALFARAPEPAFAADDPYAAKAIKPGQKVSGTLRSGNTYVKYELKDMNVSEYFGIRITITPNDDDPYEIWFDELVPDYDMPVEGLYKSNVSAYFHKDSFQSSLGYDGPVETTEGLTRSGRSVSYQSPVVKYAISEYAWTITIPEYYWALDDYSGDDPQKADNEYAYTFELYQDAPAAITDGAAVIDGELGDGSAGYNEPLLYAEAINAGVLLDWSSAEGFGYRLYRSEVEGEQGQSVTDFYIEADAFVDVNVSPNKTYYYTVRPVLAEANPFEERPELLGEPYPVASVKTLATIIGGVNTNLPGVPSTSAWDDPTYAQDDPSAPQTPEDLPDDPAASGASSLKKRFILMTIDERYMNVDGKLREIDPGYMTTPILLNSRTLVPIRSVVENMGGSVGYDDISQEITLAYGDRLVKMWPDNTRLTVNSIAQTMDVAPTVIDMRTRVPIRFAAEYLGCAVDWVESTNQIVIVF